MDDRLHQTGEIVTILYFSLLRPDPVAQERGSAAVHRHSSDKEDFNGKFLLHPTQSFANLIAEFDSLGKSSPKSSN